MEQISLCTQFVVDSGYNSWLPQGRRKQLLIGPAKGMAVKEKCAEHTQPNARGSGGMPPPGNF